MKIYESSKDYQAFEKYEQSLCLRKQKSPILQASDKEKIIVDCIYSTYILYVLYLHTLSTPNEIFINFDKLSPFQT